MARKYDLVIEQGATFKLRLIWKGENKQPLDLTSYTASLQVRETYASSDTLLSLTSEPNGGITITPTEGRIDIVIESTVTANLPAPKNGVYDLELTSPAAEVTRLLEGKVRITPGVTR